jgi:antiviral helicase SKI2
MLKRSFAEFHAQKAQPEKLQELEAGRQLLAAYAARPWPSCYVGCSRREVHEYHECNAQLEGALEAVQVRALAELRLELS